MAIEAKGARVVERLTLEAASEHTLIATEHRHRYELAAELCAGLRVLDLCCGSGYGCRILRETAAAVTGVDVDAATIDLAGATVGRETDVEFVAVDASDYLDEDLKNRFDAMVMFEGLEHLAAPERALEQLRGYAEAGTKLMVSVPNSRAFAEENPYHITNYGFDEFRAAFERFPQFVPMYQFLAEGSLIRGEEVRESDIRHTNQHGELPYANHFIACVGFEPERSGLASGRMQLTTAPVFNRHLLDLEGANKELRRANARLSRKLIGTADSAAATLVAKLKRAESELAALREQLEERERAEKEARELHEWIEHLHAEIEHHRSEVEGMQATRVWRLAGRYWALRDRILRRHSG
jgi:SAM-dependent methyltransferase